MEFVIKFVNYFNVNLSSIRIVLFIVGFVVMKFQFDLLEVFYDECDFFQRVKFFFEDGDDVNFDFKKVFEFEFLVELGNFEGFGFCGVVVDVLLVIKLGWWKIYVIILVVIFVVVFFVVGICLFFVLWLCKR